MPIQKLTIQHLNFMNIGKRFWEATVDGMSKHQQTAIGSYLSKFRESIDQGIGLYIWGRNGVGKTYLSSVLCKEVWLQFRVASYCVTASELKECWISDHIIDGADETVLQRCERIRFLVVDDLGKEHRAASGFAENKFGALIRSRSRRKFVTIITGNLSPTELTEVYGISTTSLLKENTYIVHLKDDDHRNEAAIELQKFIEG